MIFDKIILTYFLQKSNTCYAKKGVNMDTSYMKQYIEEMRTYCNETFNETSNEPLNDKPINDNKCFNNTSSINVTLNEKFLPRKQYFEMLFKLEKEFSVYKPKSLFFKYGLEHCYRIFKYVESRPDVKNKGAYFRVMLEKTA